MVVSAIEQRTFATCELRAESSGTIRKLTGYAARFNELSEDFGGLRERIAPGAFRDSLNGDVRALWNHDTNIVLGRTTAGTLKVREDERGLFVEILPPDTEQVRGMLESIRRGDVTQMSIGFRVEDDGEAWSREGDTTIRTLTRLRLYEVSPVAFPAYPTTSVEARNRAIAPVDELATVRLRLRLLDVAARAAGVDL